MFQNALNASALKGLADLLIAMESPAVPEPTTEAPRVKRMRKASWKNYNSKKKEASKQSSLEFWAKGLLKLTGPEEAAISAIRSVAASTFDDATVVAANSSNAHVAAEGACPDLHESTEETLSAWAFYLSRSSPSMAPIEQQE